MQDNDNEKTTIRLQVALAHAGVASRRACEKIITDGHVTVNGVTVTEMGTKVSLTDKICVDGKEVHQEEHKRYIAHKMVERQMSLQSTPLCHH